MLKFIADVVEGTQYEYWYLSQGQLGEGESEARLNLTFTALVMEGLVLGFIGWSKYQYCQLFDHKLIDGGSHFTADSGTECLECSRCGWSWSHTYY